MRQETTAVPTGAELWLNSGALLAGAIIARLSRASAILICARLLRPERFGEVVAALAAYEMLRVIGEAGLDTRLIRHIAREPTQTRKLTATTISLKIKIYTFLIASGLAVAILRIGSADWHLFASIAIGTFGIAVTGSAQAVVTARLDAKALLPYQAASGAAFLVMVGAAAAVARTSLATALAIGLADLAGGVIQSGYLRRIGALSRLTLTSPASDRAALSESWPVGGVTAVATAYGRLGIGALALAAGATAVAQYGVAYRVVEVFLLASSAVAGAAYAATARVEAAGSDGASRLLLESILKRTVLPVTVLAVTVAGAAGALRVFLGPNYSVAVATTRVLAFALPPMFLNGLLTAHLYGQGRYRTVFRIALINLLVNLGLLAALLPSGGPPAVALAVVTTECANTFLQGRAAQLPLSSLPYQVAALSLLASLILFLGAIHGG